MLSARRARSASSLVLRLFSSVPTLVRGPGAWSASRRSRRWRSARRPGPVHLVAGDLRVRPGRLAGQHPLQRVEVLHVAVVGAGRQRGRGLERVAGRVVGAVLRRGQLVAHLPQVGVGEREVGRRLVALLLELEHLFAEHARPRSRWS